MTIKLSNKIIVEDKRVSSYIRAIQLLLRIYDRIYLIGLNRYIPKTILVAKKSGRIVYYRVERDGVKRDKSVIIVVGKDAR